MNHKSGPEFIMDLHNLHYLSGNEQPRIRIILECFVGVSTPIMLIKTNNAMYQGTQKPSEKMIRTYKITNSSNPVILFNTVRIAV